MGAGGLRYLGRIALLAVAYAAAGKLGLLLAIPPGYATPIWPPTGIALGGLLLLGARMWPGVWLGSFAVNVWMHPEALGLAAVIGTGAALQAVAGVWMVRRWVGFPTALTRECQVFVFLLVAGPGQSLINATLSVGALALAGTTPVSGVPANWLTWWIGDALGGVVFTPVLLTLFGHPRDVWRPRLVTVALPLLLQFALLAGMFQLDLVNPGSPAERLWLLVTTSLGLTGALGGWLLLATGREELIREEVRARTEELRTEVAERKRAEERFRGLVERGYEGVTCYDAAGRITYASPNNTRLDGRTPEEALMTDGFSYIHPDDRATALATWMEMLSHPERPASLTLRVSHKDGSWMWVEAVAQNCADNPALGCVVLNWRDVTERKLAEDALRRSHEELERRVAERTAELLQSEQRLALALDAASDGHWEWDISTGRMYHSPQWLRLLGYGLGDVDEQNGFLSRLVHPADAASSEGVLAEHLAGATAVKECEVRLRTKSGAYLWVLNRGKVVARDATGAPTRMTGTITDISARKEMEAKLRASEARYRLLVEQASDGIFLHGEDGTVLDINLRACESLGYTRGELIGMGVSVFDPGVSPELLAEVLRQLDAGHSLSFDATHRRKDGTTFPVEVRLNPFQMEGRRVALAVVRDITERKRSEQALRENEAKYRTLFESSGDAIFLMQGDLFTDCNTRALEVFGCASRDQLVGQPPYRFSPSQQPDGRDSVQAAREKIGAALAGTPQRFVWEHTRLDGTAFPADVSLNAVTLGGKQLLQAIARDTTERDRYERTLRTSLREKETLLREVHHRVKNNLQIIASLLYFQGQKLADPAGLAAVNECRDRLRSMVLLHQKLYQTDTLSRIDAADYIRTLVRELQTSYSALRPGASVEVVADPLLLSAETALPVGMLVCELVTNAFKYAFPDTGGRVEVSFVSAGAGRLLLTVSDDGIGLPPGFAPGATGGFGWQLIESLIQQLGGDLRLTSPPGTRVEISIPITDLPSA